MSNPLAIEKSGTALVIRFDRPAIRSPLSVSVLEELGSILNEIERPDNGTERVIFTGREKVFASGADLREIAALTPEGAREFAVRGQNLMDRIAALRQMTIAAINGYCFGGALDLALACDKRIASGNAAFAHPGVSLGIITGWGGTQRLPRLIGTARALVMFLTAEKFPAEAAFDWGLVDEIDDDPLRMALSLAVGKRPTV